MSHATTSPSARATHALRILQAWQYARECDGDRHREPIFETETGVTITVYWSDEDGGFFATYSMSDLLYRRLSRRLGATDEAFFGIEVAA